MSSKMTKNLKNYRTVYEKQNGLAESQQFQARNRISLPKRQLFTLGVLCLGQFCLAASISLQAPFFPGEALSKGMSATVYGFVFGAFELAVVVFSPIFGKIVVWVHPNFLIKAGLFSSGTICVLFGSLSVCPPGLPFAFLAFLLRILEGVACAAVTTASYTTVAALFAERVATFFSVLGTCFGFGLIVGPTLGGLLYQAQGFGLPFYVIGSTLLFSTICAWFVLPDHKGGVVKSGNIREFLSDPGIFVYAFSIITSFMYIGYYTTNLEIYLRPFGLQPAVVGAIFVITGTIYGITSPFWGFICDKGADPLLLTVGGSVFVCLGLLLLGPAPFIPVSPNLWLIITSLVIGGLGVAAKIVCSFTGSLKNAMARGFPHDMGTHGLVSALFSSTTSIGAFIGPSLGGYLWDSVGFRKGSVVYFSIELLFIVLTVLYIIRNSRCNKRTRSSASFLEPSIDHSTENPYHRLLNQPQPDFMSSL